MCQVHIRIKLNEFAIWNGEALPIIKKKAAPSSKRRNAQNGSSLFCIWGRMLPCVFTQTIFFHVSVCVPWFFMDAGTNWRACLKSPPSFFVLFFFFSCVCVWAFGSFVSLISKPLFFFSSAANRYLHGRYAGTCNQCSFQPFVVVFFYFLEFKRRINRISNTKFFFSPSSNRTLANTSESNKTIFFFVCSRLS